MAEAFLQLLLDNLSSLIKNEIGTIMGVDDEMEKLASTLTAIQAVLEDAELRQEESRAIRDWLSKLQNLTYEIDDILDECSTEVNRLRQKGSKSHRYNLKNILYERKIGRRMKQVANKLDVVAQERAQFHLREMPIEIEKQSKVAFPSETSSLPNELDHVYGREEEKEKIVDILVNQVKDCQQLSVLPIIGIGGLGKTTLAQLVFNDSRVVKHFDTKLWVCISDNFDLKTLVKAMIESAATHSENVSHLVYLDTLIHRLRKLLDQRRYLIVFDDVWNEDQEKWYALKNILACGSTGASIMLTTRLKKVAEIMLTRPAHYLAELPSEDCWKLLKQRALGQEDKLPTNLEVIGKQIVEKCVGVPLAAKTLGSLLRFKRDEREWVHIKESEIWDLPQEETSILPALKLSYHHLPLIFRQCFVYCAVYPKDDRMYKKDLIHMWIAHGYILSNQQKEEEDVGDEIWNELVLRSFFQDVEYSSFGVTFRMHDLVHDLARSILDNKVHGAQHETHTRSAHNNKIRQVNLRKRLMAFPIGSLTDTNLSSIIKKFSRLRSLDASMTREDLPSIIIHLRHLRHLDLSWTHVKTLPKAICSLWNLKILNLKFCLKLVQLPKNMSDMHNLRHVILEGCWSLSEIPPNIGQLNFLKTWSLFIVGHGKGNQLEELQYLDLGDLLYIMHLERVKSHVDAKKANLAGKPNLRRLSLQWDADISLVENEDDNILEALEPHPNLEELAIIGFRGKKFPFWMENSTVENIVGIRICKCPNILCLPEVLGELPHLQELRLSNLAVEYIIEDEGASAANPLKPKFPSLETLRLHDLLNLKGLWKEEMRQVQMFPNLKKLDIAGCPSLVLQELPSVQKLLFRTRDRLMLTSIPMLKNLTDIEINTDAETDGPMTLVLAEGFKNLTDKLEELEIKGRHDLCLPEQCLGMLKSVTRVSIWWNETMRCLPEMWMPNLTALQTLSIIQCPEFMELPDGTKYLHNLTYMYLCDLPKMIRLPEALRFLPSLESLFLNKLTQLASLPDWLAELTHLSRLQIEDCKKLVLLPDVVQEMRSIQHLRIAKCPELEKRCEKGKGEDWHKIKHIPHIQIQEIDDNFSD